MLFLFDLSTSGPLFASVGLFVMHETPVMLPDLRLGCTMPSFVPPRQCHIKASVTQTCARLDKQHHQLRANHGRFLESHKIGT